MTNIPNLATQMTLYTHDLTTLQSHLWDLVLQAATPATLKALAEDIPTTDIMGAMLSSSLRTLAREKQTTAQVKP